MVPILKQGGYLIATVQAALSDRDLADLRDALVERVGRFRSRGVIIDVTAMDVLGRLGFTEINIATIKEESAGKP